MDFIERSCRRTALAAAMLVGCLALQATAHAASRNCTAAEKADGDKWLWLSRADKAFSVQRHLPWGMPVERTATDNEILLVQRDYVNLYDADLRVPLWSAERIDASRIGKVKDRVNCFRADPRLTAAQASAPSDYDEPLYDQGHMAPDADQDSSVRAAINTYVMSNMAPQTCEFNRGIWQILEGITRGWARQHKTVHVFMGSVFDRDSDGLRDPDASAPRMISRNGRQNVAIPSAFYRITAVANPDGSVSTLSILLPHNSANPNGDDAVRYLQEHVTSLARIEALTGLDLLPAANDVQESETLWELAEPAPRSLCYK